MLKVKPFPRIVFLLSICVVFAVCFAFFAAQPRPIQSGEKKISYDLVTLRANHLNNLTSMLLSSDTNVRAAGIELLGKTSEPSAAALIKKYLLDRNRNVVMETAMALSRHKDKSGVPALIKIVNEKPKNIGTKPVERVKWATTNIARAKAAEYLGKIGDRRALEPLQNAAKEDEGRIKDAALVALIRLGDKSQIGVFTYGLDSGFDSGMEKSLEVLGDLKETSAKERMRELAKSWNKNLKRAALIALGKIGDTDSSANIRSLLTDKEPGVRAAAAESIGYLRDLNSLDALKTALNDTNGFVRLNAAEALMKLGDDTGEHFIETAIKAGDLDARLKAIRILADFGIESNISPLEEAFKNENNLTTKMEISAAIIRIIDREK